MKNKRRNALSFEFNDDRNSVKTERTSEDITEQTEKK